MECSTLLAQLFRPTTRQRHHEDWRDRTIEV